MSSGKSLTHDKPINGGLLHDLRPKNVRVGLFCVPVLSSSVLDKTFPRRWSPPARRKSLVQHDFGVQRAAQDLSNALAESSVSQKTFATRARTKDGWKRALRQTC